MDVVSVVARFLMPAQGVESFDGAALVAILGLADSGSGIEYER